MKKILMVIVAVAVVIIGGNFLLKKVKEKQNINRAELCSNAYACVIDANDKEIQHCKSLNGLGKEVEVKCKSFSVCADAYKCTTDDNDYGKVNCKIDQNDKVYDITCPNTYCSVAYGCVDDETNSKLLKCRYMDYNRNEENNIKCPKN